MNKIIARYKDLTKKQRIGVGIGLLLLFSFLLAEDENNKNSFTGSEFARNNSDSQNEFITTWMSYRETISFYEKSLFDENLSLRKGEEKIDEAYETYLAYFYPNGNEDAKENSHTLQGDSLPKTLLNFVFTDNLQIEVEDWNCYVRNTAPVGSSSSICAIYVETDTGYKVIPVYDHFIFKNRGIGFKTKSEEYWKDKKNHPKLYVGDQIKFSGDSIYMYSKNSHATFNPKYDNFLSKLSHIGVHNAKWSIFKEDAVKWTEGTCPARPCRGLVKK